MEGIKQTSVNLSKSFSELIKTNLIEEEQENMNQSGEIIIVNIVCVETYKLTLINEDEY